MSISSYNSLSLSIYEGSYADGLIGTSIRITKRVGVVSICDEFCFGSVRRLDGSCNVI